MVTEATTIERRRVEAARLVLDGNTYRSIAETLGCSPATVSEDVAGIKGAWQDSYAVTYAEHVSKELAKLDRVERRLWPLIDRARPASWAVEAFVKVSRRRAQLLGLDRPETVAVWQQHHLHYTRAPEPDDGGRRLVDFATDLMAQIRAEQRVGNGAG